ncbi:MAG: N-acyl homoserine lactonase family protein [Mesorhizobium sp.]
MAHHQIYALRYATHDRPGSANFVGGSDDLHQLSMPLHYYVWLIRGPFGDILVDVGFGEEQAARRGRHLIERPARLLARIGVDPAAIRDVIITHMHYDHAGCIEDFPNARFHLQDAEMAYATGRHMRHKFLRQSYSVEDVVALVRRLYDDRVVFHSGASSVFEGVRLHMVGGHTLGLQSVIVDTIRGPVVLASDAFHLYRNLTDGLPFPIVHDVGEMMEGWRELMAIAGDLEHLIPGHDPLVGELYPLHDPAASSDVFALHFPPRPHENP